MNKNDKINNLNDKYIELLAEINKTKRIINEQSKNKENQNQNEIEMLKNKIEKLELNNKNNNMENNKLITEIEEKKEQINKLEILNKELNEKNKELNNIIKLNNNNNKNNNQIMNNNIDENENNNNLENNIIDNNINELNNLDSFEILENKLNHNRRPSTPSFKSPEPQNDNLEENETNKELKKLIDLLLNKVKEYESILNINNESNNEIDKKLSEINDINNINNINNIKDDINSNELDINYFQNKYINYFKLYEEYKKKYEFLKVENENLNERINNNINNNCNNLATTFSSIKLNYQYNPNDYFILCDKTYKQFKWYLMKKQSEYSQNDTYDNLIWASSLDVVDIDKYNEYSNDEEVDNIEMFNIIKKLEEKENIISKLSYKVEKLEKEIIKNKNQNINNSLSNNELFTENYRNNDNETNKKKNKKNKIIKYFNNSINDENSFNDNKCVISFRKTSTKNENDEEKKNISQKILKTEGNDIGIPLEKFNIILEKLNQTEAQFVKLQKENIELKNKRFYLNQNNNIVNILPNNDIDKEKNDNENNNCIINFSSDINKLTLMGNNFINNINDDGLGLLNNTKNINNNNITKEENENYKIKSMNLEKKLEMFKEACKNILIKLKIPKKEKEEIRQIIAIFDFTDEEICLIFGDKKGKNSKK